MTDEASLRALFFAAVHGLLLLALLHRPPRPLVALTSCAHLCLPLVIVDIAVRADPHTALTNCMHSPMVAWDTEQLVVQTLALVAFLSLPCDPGHHAERWLAVAGAGVCPNLLRLGLIGGGWCTVRAFSQPCVVCVLAPVVRLLQRRLLRGVRARAGAAEAAPLLDEDEELGSLDDDDEHAQTSWLAAWQAGA